ncbi:calcium-transporting ATPase 3 [Purpureocillium lavendulum]|uniref:Calcium-transporting ATPase 3 n=1 Tax=Purpureocillium lavendulum TaxID=1247861 RepID=A0AB34G5U4_9HYPO|nr:calcium-transporting ATPase 3 [Purpureocillium lavendulum]
MALPKPEPVTGQAHVSGQSNKPISRPAHSLTSDDVVRELQVDPARGLSPDDASRRLAEVGRNELKKQKGVQPLAILLEQIFNAMTLVLILALAASFAIKAWIEGALLGSIILFNIVTGFRQSLQAERTIASLRTLSSPTCNVFRNADTVRIQTAEVVPGDIIDLQTGDTVPADIRLIEAVNLEADEALLTGESVPILKSPNAIFEKATGPGDRLNVAYSSTTITKGRGRGVVFATGMFTEIGAIASALNGSPDESTDQEASMFSRAWRAMIGWLADFLGLAKGTPLQRKLSQLFCWLFAFAIACGIIVLGANKFKTSKDVILYAVTTAIGTIPVSLLLALTVSLAAGAKTMVDRHVIVRNMSSLEALGGVTNICSDKTGTITMGKMIARKAWLPGCGTYSVESGNEVYNPTTGCVSFDSVQPKDTLKRAATKSSTSVSPAVEASSSIPLQWYLNIASLANLATLETVDDSTEKPGITWKAKGAPTEIAMAVFAARFGWNRTQLTQGTHAKWSHIAEFPFDSDVKKMSVILRDVQSQGAHIFTKGAVEQLLNSCDRIAMDMDINALTEMDKANVISNMEALASQGLRVLALAHRPCDGPVSEADFLPGGTAPSRALFERNLIFRGLIGIYDPLAPTRAIAADVSILPPPDKMRLLPIKITESMVMTAQQFDALSDDQIDALQQLPLVVARCTPSTKVRMIEALHRRQRYVAMTGDGVNDSPSLKHADIGIAMGTGSDVAKTSADIVLTDDNFSSILNAIEEGRRIFDNIQKFILHILAANIGFVLALLIGLAFQDDSNVSVFLLTPVEILFLLMGTGAFCETGLGFEKGVPDILNRPPHDVRILFITKGSLANFCQLKHGIFSPELILDMIVYGVLMAICMLGSFTVVIFGFGGGDLGFECNHEYSDSCDAVFRARATCYAAITWVFLFYTWVVTDLRRSFFYMPNGFQAWGKRLWDNQFLFWSIVGVFIATFATLYIPVLNRDVFLHSGIGWEWGVVAITFGIFVVGVELWKWAKRVYIRRKTPAPQVDWTGDA